MNWQRTDQFALPQEARIDDLIERLTSIRRGYKNVPVYVSIDKVNDWHVAIELDGSGKESAIRLTGNGQLR